MKRSRAVIGTALFTSTVTSLALLATTTPATAAPDAETVASGLIGPLQLDVGERNGQPFVVVAESFAGLLSLVREGQDKEVLHAERNSEISGVAIEGRRVAFLTTRNSDDRPGAFLKILKGDGSVETVANLYKYEETQNPDADQRYGIRGIGEKCEEKLPDEPPGLAPYEGIVESHPYALADAPGGGWYVADAAGNTILKVSPRGDIETVAVLPAQRAVVTEGAAEANNLPRCAVGQKAMFEAVPTDVEVDDRGRLVVSLLPGGPEDPSFGARGKVVRIAPTTGDTTLLAKGLESATNVAIGGRAVFVSELFGGRISKIRNDNVSTYYEAPAPAGLEWMDGYLIAAVDVFNQSDGGQLVVLSQGGTLD